MTRAFNIDCMEGMARFRDKEFDLAIVDPPYGIGASKRIGTTLTAGRNKKGFYSMPKYSAKLWDSSPPSTDYFVELERVSQNQIIWGGTYFTLPLSRGWIFWDKKISNASNENYADGELAWTSFDRVLKRFTYDWNGLGGINSGEKRIHPTQKPVALYRWLLKNYAKVGDKILDTHLGSGSSRIACHEAGYDFTGFELDKDYFDAQEKRFQKYLSQQVLEFT